MGKQPSMGQKKTKEAIAKAALASRKTSKKKWGKTGQKEKKDFNVFLNKDQFADMSKEIVKMRLVTPSILAEKFKVIMSVAKQAIKYFASENKIKELGKQTKHLPLFTGIEAKPVVDETVQA